MSGDSFEEMLVVRAETTYLHMYVLVGTAYVPMCGDM